MVIYSCHLCQAKNTVMLLNCVVFAKNDYDHDSFSPSIPRRQHTTLGKEIAFMKDKLSHLWRM